MTQTQEPDLDPAPTRANEPQPKRILHVVVGGFPWTDAPVRYRRHRLAEYLSGHETTAAVYWIYSHSVSRRSWRRFWAVPRNHVGSARSGPGKNIWEFGIPTRRTITLHGEILHRRLLMEVVRRVRSHPADMKVLWFTVPIYSYLRNACTWDHVVYDCSDHWTGEHADTAIRSRILAALKSRSEDRVSRKSDLVFASSQYLAGRLDRRGRQVTLVENGVEVDRFRAAQPPTALAQELPSRPRLAFVGTLKEFKIDFRLLHSMAVSVPEYSFVLVGPVHSGGRELEQLLELPNVVWVGARRPHEIPGLLKLMDVGLLPYREVTYNRGVFPLKFFEYLAAGLPVVGCGLPSTSHYAQDEVYIHTTANPSEFIAACRVALSWPASARLRVAIAQRHDWRPKLAFMHANVLRSLGVVAPNTVPVLDPVSATAAHGLER